MRIIYKYTFTKLFSQRSSKDAKVWLYKTETDPSKKNACTSRTEGLYFSFQKPNNKTVKLISI